MTFLPKLIFWEVSVLVAGFAGIIFWKILTGTMSLDYLLQADDPSGGTSFSPGRAQLLMFTIIVAMQYLLQAINNPTKFPDVPQLWIAALGGSQAVYLAGKAQSLGFFGRK